MLLLSIGGLSTLQNGSLGMPLSAGETIERSLNEGSNALGIKVRK